VGPDVRKGTGCGAHRTGAKPRSRDSVAFSVGASCGAATMVTLHARALLERAEKLAGLEPLQGRDFHPYRRAWATARKHLPLPDVAHARGWKRTETPLLSAAR
jgi:hypothetical protein